MQALRVEQLSDDLSGCALVDIQVPKPAADEVLVRVAAASINFPDLLMTSGGYQFKPDVPFTCGLEMAGTVVEAPASSPFKPGDKVMGGAKTGAMAEYAALPARSLRLMPVGLGFAQAAALGAAYTTAYTSLVELGGMKKGQWVLVHGASGGVGLAAVDLALALGAKIIATSASEEKLERIQKIYQPDATIVAQGRFRQSVAELTGGALADLVLDPVGGDVFDESTRCVAFGGKLLVVGFAGGRIPQIAVNIPLIKGFSIVGVRAGEYSRRFPDRGKAIAQTVSDMAANGTITPHIDHQLPLSRWREGFEAMASRQLVGKVVLLPGS